MHFVAAAAAAAADSAFRRSLTWADPRLQASSVFTYGYEYQGNNGRLVVTPLTDQCYMALGFALCDGKAGNILGPAGIGVPYRATCMWQIAATLVSALTASNELLTASMCYRKD